MGVFCDSKREKFPTGWSHITLSRAGRCGASRRVARQLSTSGNALSVDFGEFCFVL
jgi:hypothetical protein